MLTKLSQTDLQSRSTCNSTWTLMFQCKTLTSTGSGLMKFLLFTITMVNFQSSLNTMSWLRKRKSKNKSWSNSLESPIKTSSKFKKKLLSLKNNSPKFQNNSNLTKPSSIFKPSRPSINSSDSAKITHSSTGFHTLWKGSSAASISLLRASSSWVNRLWW